MYASDYPYGRQPNSLLMARSARRRLAGFDDRQLRGMLGETALAHRRRRGAAPVADRARRGDALVQPLTFARIHQYISMAVPMLWLRQRDAIGALGLAVNASRERDGHRGGLGADRGAARDRAASSGARAARSSSDDERVAAMRTAIQLVNLADLIAVTTRA